MEKALQDCFYVQMNDKTGNTLKRSPERYDRKFVSYLIDGANNHVTQLKGRASNQSDHDEFIFWCMSEYLKNGASSALLNTLNRYMSVVGHQCHVSRTDKKLVAMFIAHIPQNPPPQVFASYMFSNMTSLGWLEGLKKCKNPECCQFFIGRPNVKWCSKSCGSLYRVRQKRKRDKA